MLSAEMFANVSITSRRGTVADQVHAEMLNAIMEGELTSGQEVRDKEWSERLGVSRTPAREAIQRLHGIGLLDVAPARYTRLRSYTYDSAQHAVHEWADIHAALISYAVRDVSDQLVHDLQVIVDRHRNVDDVEQIKAHFAFFERIRSATPNFGLQLGASASAYRYRLAMSHLPYLPRRDGDLHGRVISALVSSRMADAVEALNAWAAVSTTAAARG